MLRRTVRPLQVLLPSITNLLPRRPCKRSFNNVCRMDEFWSDVEMQIKGLNLPQRFHSFVESLRRSDDLDRIYDTDPREGLPQRVKAFGDYPGLTHQPIHDTQSLAFAGKLEKEARTIRSELETWLEKKVNAKPRSASEAEAKGDDAWTTRFFNESYGDSFHGIAL